MTRHPHDDTKDLGASCEIVASGVATDDDVIELVTNGLLDGLPQG